MELQQTGNAAFETAPLFVDFAEQLWTVHAVNQRNERNNIFYLVLLQMTYEGLLAAKRGDLKTAKNSFLEAQRVDPNSPAAEMLGMISDIYDFYYKDNLNP